MKKSLVATVLLGAMGFASTAMAIDASNVFTWTGTVPAAPQANNWVIKSPAGQNLTNGIMVFTLAADGKGVLTGSTEIAFSVFQEDGAGTGNPDLNNKATSYDVELTSLAVNSAGLAAEQAANGYFSLLANGVPLAKNAVTGMTDDTLLTIGVGTVGAPNQPSAGDSVDLQATIVVTNSQV